MMYKRYFVIILMIFSQSTPANSIYDNHNAISGKNIYNKQKEKLKNNNDYLKNYKVEKLEEISPETYGGRDTTGKKLSYNLKNLEKISYATSKELISKISSFRRYHTGLSFYGFAHDYSPKFKSIFYDAKKADSMVGSLIFSLDQKLIGNELTLSYLTGVGVSFFKGSGYFADDGSEANMRITLWILPVDFGLASTYSLGSYARILFGGGLSVVGAIQSRSDLEEDNSEKVIFQFGYGPFVSAKLNIGINKIFPKFSLAMFRDYGVTNSFFNIEYRLQNYSNFKDNFTIKGSAIGGGVSFNFM